MPRAGSSAVAHRCTASGPVTVTSDLTAAGVWTQPDELRHVHVFATEKWYPEPLAKEDQQVIQWFALDGPMPTPALPSLEPTVALLRQHAANLAPSEPPDALDAAISLTGGVDDDEWLDQEAGFTPGSALHLRVTLPKAAPLTESMQFAVVTSAAGGISL